jgi:hypothetical protein
MTPFLRKLSLTLGLCTLTKLSWAAPAFAPPGNGQSGLAVGNDASGVLRAAACTAEPCRVDGGVALDVPAALRPNIGRARLAVVGIGSGRRAIVVTVPGAAFGQSYEAVVAMPPGAREPRVVFQGLTGLVEGSEGVRQGKSVTISEPDDHGARRIVVGDEREDLNLCGRRAVLAPSLLSPDDLSLKPARVQRLSAAERDQAPKLAATKLDAAAAPAGASLRALGASSAIGTPWALTDGKTETSWGENRGGNGRGEFVVLSAPQELPIAAFDLALPAGRGPRDVPKELWLVTRGEVFLVTLPPDATANPGQRYRAALPKPVSTDCVALVIESSFDDKPDSRLAVAELSAVTEFAGQSPESLVAALAGGAERARAAGAALRALGTPGYAAISRGFEALDAGGRSVALDVIDSAPCDVSAPLYVRALGGGVESHVLHARDRIPRCAEAATEPLLAAASSAQGAALALYGAELVTVAPGRAVDALTPRLGKLGARDRRAVRVLLGRAAGEPSADAALRRFLGDATLAPAATIDLLRAIGPRIAHFGKDAQVALARLGGDPSFRTRYLLLEPAAALAESDPGAASVLAKTLSDAREPRLRTRALEVAPRSAAYAPAFSAALADGDVRVREAAAYAIGEGRFTQGRPALSKLLEDDAWPIARRAAATSLGRMPDDAASRAVLIAAIGDEAPWVRAAAIESLGLRRSPGAADPVREKLDDREERVEVRRAAALTLGALCDQKSVDLLDKLARRIADPMSSPEDRAIGEASLYALLQIHPQDLEARLAPISKGPAATAVRRARARIGAGCGAR